MKHLTYESEIESYLIRKVKSMGGLCIKIGYDGLPDRLCLFPGGKVVWAELKRDDGELSNLQIYWIGKLNGVGQRVFTPRSKTDIDEMLRSI